VTGDLTRLSRFLSYVLRHDPGAVGIELDPGGWVDVDTLLTALAAHGRPIGVDTLHALVAGTDKVRLQLRDGCRAPCPASAPRGWYPAGATTSTCRSTCRRR
jgi:putative RNA 2'-phosphotransferase